MWVLRRAANPLRIQRYHLGAYRAFYAKSDTLSDDFAHGIRTCETNLRISSRFHPVPKRFHQKPSIGVKLSLWSHGLSSQAGKKNDEESISESELSDDDSEESVTKTSQNELELSGIEKKKTHLEFIKVIMAAPRESIHGALDKWVEEGNPLSRFEVSQAMFKLRKRLIYGKALQLSEWLEENKRLKFNERDYVSRLDLIAKVRGLEEAEKYIDHIPESFRDELIYRTLLANCSIAADIKKAEEVFNKMKDLKLPITAFACNQLLLLYNRFDKKKIADLQLYMENKGIKPTLVMYRFFMDSKGESNDIEGMEKLLETMKTDGLEPDIMIQAMLARHYISSGLNEKAEVLLKEIEGEKLEENREACRSLLRLYADFGKADEVERIWAMCLPDPRIKECAAAIEAWGKLGRIEDAESAFDRIRRKKKHALEHYTVLLKVYENHKLLDKAKELGMKMGDKFYVELGEVEKGE